ncbi:MAG: phosphate starvation-inducible protein PhoH [Deltaproteobacteria bacterium RIFOXYD12_FULL_55_16]|nr:MAG: phosphate starvation-inducible protein PhoH [Deltaproteobacteria bacterium RIFOXYD12_FULL_55_16]
MIKKGIVFIDNNATMLVYGDLDKNLAILEEGAGVSIQVQGSRLTVSGPQQGVDLAISTIDKLHELIRSGYLVYPSDVAYALRIMQTSPQADLKEIFLDKVCIAPEHKAVSPKSVNQKLYLDNIRNNDLVFGIGPAGTGKTYLAVAMAVSAFTSKQVRSIILARPAVEAGERLSLPPGDLAQKINPYMRPLHEALNAMLGRGKVTDLIEEGLVEIAPLAFMRGRTLNNAFVILDEAQNTTHEQMKMFLTRLGANSKAVITGDITQIDLPDCRQSGLIEASRILQDIKGIAFNQFSEVDVVRHQLVQEIISAYADKETLPPPRRATV